MSVMYKNNSNDSPKPTTLNTVTTIYHDKNSNNNISVNSSPATTIKLNDFLVRLSTQEKIENDRQSNFTKFYPISKDNNYGKTSNQSDPLKDKFSQGKSTLYENRISVEKKRSDPTSNFSHNFTSPYININLKNTSNNTSKFQQPTTFKIDSSVQNFQSNQKSYSSSSNLYPSLKKFSAAPPPQYDHLVLKTSTEVVMMDPDNQSQSSDHFNSILRPREKKIIKPPQSTMKSCQTNDEVLTLDKSAFVEQFSYQDQSVFVSDSKIEASPLLIGRKSQIKKNPYNHYNVGGVGNSGVNNGGVNSGDYGGTRGGVNNGTFDVSKCEADYCNLDILMGNNGKTDNKSESLYVNNQPKAAPRRTFVAENADKVKRLNSFFGEKKDSVTELESKIFYELIMKEEEQKRRITTNSSATNHKSVNLTSSLPLDSRSIHSEMSISSSTNEGDRLKRVVKNNLKNFNKNLNKSCENLLSSITNNNAINNIPSWKKKLMKGVKSHFKQMKPDKPSLVVESHILPLNLCPKSFTNQNLPFLVECCTEVIEKRGMRVEGVYRLPSKHAIVNQLFKHVQKEPSNVDLYDDVWRDISCVGGLLKLFLRKLPEPLITQELYEGFIAASSMQPAYKMATIRNLVKILPIINHETLRHLASHLHLVASHASQNTMDAHNLAIMFGPSLVHSKMKATRQMLMEMSAQIDVIENTIKYNEWIFSDKPVEELVLQENNNNHNNNKINRLKKEDKASSIELLPSVETLLELAGSDEENEDEEDEGGSKFAFIRHHLFTRSAKSTRLFMNVDEFGEEKVNKSDGSLGGTYKKKK